MHGHTRIRFANVNTDDGHTPKASATWSTQQSSRSTTKKGGDKDPPCWVCWSRSYNSTQPASDSPKQCACERLWFIHSKQGRRGL